MGVPLWLYQYLPSHPAPSTSTQVAQLNLHLMLARYLRKAVKARRKEDAVLVQDDEDVDRARARAEEGVVDTPAPRAFMAVSASEKERASGWDIVLAITVGWMVAAEPSTISGADGDAGLAGHSSTTQHSSWPQICRNVAILASCRVGTSRMDEIGAADEACIGHEQRGKILGCLQRAFHELLMKRELCMLSCRPQTATCFDIL